MALTGPPAMKANASVDGAGIGGKALVDDALELRPHQELELGVTAGKQRLDRRLGPPDQLFRLRGREGRFLGDHAGGEIHDEPKSAQSLLFVEERGGIDRGISVTRHGGMIARAPENEKPRSRILPE